MIARVSILVPFHPWIPENAALAPIELDQPPYHLAVHSPRQVMHTETQNAPDEPIPLGRLTASPNLEFSDFFRVQTEPGKEVWRTARADLFQIDIRASDFDRREENCENNAKKLAQIGLAALNSVSRKLRLLTHSPVLTQLELQQIRWSIEYLDDDCRELTQETGKIRRYSGENRRLTLTLVTESVWNSARSPQPKARWRELLLDAELLRIHPGPAVVLAATAIETLIDTVLEHVAANSSLPKGLWEWITNRDDNFTKQPSFKERCGELLKFLTGSSLKDDSKLWQAFTKIKDVRDRFVHEGTLSTSEVEIVALLESAKDVIAYLEGFLPQELRTPVFENFSFNVNPSMKNVSNAPIILQLFTRMS